MSLPETEDYSIIKEKGMLPDSISELKTEDEPEIKPFLISYQKYNKKLCEVDLLPKNCPVKVLHSLRKISQDIIEFKDFNSNGISSKPIKHAGEYKKLFNGLHDDVELYEHMLQGTSRMFYFINEINKIIYIVAITQKHFETEKTRR